MNNLTISQINTNEIERYSKSDSHWVRVKNNKFSKVIIQTVMTSSFY